MRPAGWAALLVGNASCPRPSRVLLHRVIEWIILTERAVSHFMINIRMAHSNYSPFCVDGFTVSPAAATATALELARVQLVAFIGAPASN